MNSMDISKLLTCVVEGHNAVVGGQAGSGKSTILLELLNKLEGMGKRCLVTATTGMAAASLKMLFRSCPQTLHQALGLLDGTLTASVS